jgi:hypothetical protein
MISCTFCIVIFYIAKFGFMFKALILIGLIVSESYHKVQNSGKNLEHIDTILILKNRDKGGLWYKLHL